MTNLDRLDAHIVTAEEYEELPELTDEMIARADLYHGDKLIRRGRPLGSGTKQAISVRLDADLIAAMRKQGHGWQTRMNEALRQTYGL